MEPETQRILAELLEQLATPRPTDCHHEHHEFNLLHSFQDTFSKEDIVHCVLEGGKASEPCDPAIVMERLCSDVTAEPKLPPQTATVPPQGPSGEWLLHVAGRPVNRESSDKLFLDIDLVDMFGSQNPGSSNSSAKTSPPVLCDTFSLLDRNEVSSSSKPNSTGWRGPSENRIKYCNVPPDVESSICKYIDSVVHEPFSSVLGQRCKLCPDRIFYRRHDLLTHIRNIHLHERPFQCHCGAKFKRKAHLDGHIKAVHEGSSSYICKYCKKSYSSSSSMRKHVRDLHQTEIY
eukprot:CAMPEP_0184693290 /NCGR_PEP_ID=MMETSP0313-20130426/1542_1 /TAXON_ID=2792 /ORGANISM="Porphyridium aerugineum, Strain SAG 1380-2" /LENGTH=289 /DNA_ID=CAMNT_0027151323 /DNA_START=72 /DNA_END=941 /DNA_ORIENTATION=-